MDTDVRISVRALVAERFNHMNKALYIFIPSHLAKSTFRKSGSAFCVIVKICRIKKYN